MSNGRLPELSGDGRTLAYAYSNRWSLISLVTQHRSSGQLSGDLADSRPHTLVFEVETLPRAGFVAAAGTAPTQGLARVFLRLTILGADDKGTKTLVLPRFPTRAPELGSDQQADLGSRALEKGGNPR